MSVKADDSQIRHCQLDIHPDADNFSEVMLCGIHRHEKDQTPVLSPLYFFVVAALALSTRLTMVASSIKNARVILE